MYLDSETVGCDITGIGAEMAALLGIIHMYFIGANKLTNHI
jgi:hypothetical protein